MTAASTKPMTFAEYIVFEESSEERHEFDGGQVYSMAGGTAEHAALIISLGQLLGRQLASPSRAFGESLRVRTPSGKASYPDLYVICGPLARDPEDSNSVTNPKVILEVLSKGTEAYDRGKKFAHYRSCPSFVEYVLVASQGEPRVERFVKRDGGLDDRGRRDRRPAAAPRVDRRRDRRRRALSRPRRCGRCDRARVTLLRAMLCNRVMANIATVSVR